MARLYAAADVFVLASLTEGFGIVVLEAMASGLPTLLHDGEPFRWIVGASPDARLVNMAKEGALRSELRKDWPSSPSAAQRSEVLSRFSWDVLLPEYVAMYDRVLGLPILR
jgi:glycosyltransferase involved in cell wall biosynthesis